MVYWLSTAGAAALAWLAFGRRSQHWALRALVVVGLALALVGLVVAALFAGKDAWQWEAGQGVLVGAVCGAVVGAAGAFAAGLERFGVAPGVAKMAGPVLVVLFFGAGWLASGHKKTEAPAVAVAPAVEPPAVVPAVVPAVAPAELAQVEKRTLPAAESCACGSGALCTGPRGGRYCLRPDGSKEYEKRQP